MTSLVEVYRRWPDHAAAVAHLERIRWPEGPVCPYCGHTGISRKNESQGKTLAAHRWQCQKCTASFSVTVNTIFHQTHIDLQRWYLLISLMLNAKNGLSSLQASRDLEMRQKTVWSMMQRIRAAMAKDDEGTLLSGLVEIDEAYIGGSPRKPNSRDDDPSDTPRGRGTSRQPVVGAVERDGRVKVKPVSKDAMQQADMLALVREWVRCKGSVIHADEYAGYNTLNKALVTRRINHSKCYVADDLLNALYGRVHTNTIEGFWAIVKRAIIGQFHHVSRRYLSRYLDEITFRYNHRKSKGAFDLLLGHAVKP